jgi:uncharacterized membrane protein
MESIDKLRLTSFIAALVGLVDSIYLSATKLMKTEVFCGGSTSCATVNSSRWAEIAGIPIAFLGAGMYVVILALLYLEARGGFWKEYSPLVIFGITLAGTLYSAYLTYVEIAILRAICPYCVVSAIALALLFIVSVLRLVRVEPEPKFARRGG